MRNWEPDEDRPNTNSSGMALAGTTSNQRMSISVNTDAPHGSTWS